MDPVLNKPFWPAENPLQVVVVRMSVGQVDKIKAHHKAGKFASLSSALRDMVDQFELT